ncbi:MAG: carboxypeptidase regulatory-like domain-containing protein [Myxococcales bacterium]|nr:carboxypeptidase regulatory-like domain-containing protein [Myxococcales bacterium]
MIELRPYSWALWVCVASTVVGCKEEEPPEDDTLDKGEACDPNAMPPQDGSDTDGDDGPPVCAPGLACEPVDGSDGDYVCGTAVEIRGLVTDSADGSPIEGALVAALNDASEPVTDVVATDSCGYYVLPVSVRRDSNGDFLETPKWTLNVSAQDYLPFPSGVRPALPIDLADAVADPDPPEEEGETDDESYPSDVIENGATSVALIALPSGEQGGSIVSGHVADDVAAGMLVIAEGTGGRAPYGIVDASGNYTLFNVPDGMATIRGYRRGIEVEPTSVMADGSVIEDVDLPVITADEAGLATVDGSLSIVNAPGGSQTSVVLVPTSVYVEELERGPVPVGLRVPDPPLAPDVSGSFGFVGVPAGTYKVLVAFENDLLVRDPDEGIAGTAILELTVSSGEHVDLQDNFKVTEALEVFGPGVDAPEVVDAQPTLSWADDSSEDGYVLVIYNALGELVWETEVPGVSGSASVDVPYEGPALEPGMYYQFRATSFRDPPNGDRTFISRTEDLRGVFVTGEADPPADCDPEAADGGTGG